MVAPAYDEYRSLLLGKPSDEEQRALLAPVGFTDWRAAGERLRRCASSAKLRHAMAEILPYLLIALTHSANPDRALVSFERWLDGCSQPEERLRELAVDPRALELLVTLFAGSQFLSEILLRDPAAFSLLIERQQISAPRQRSEYLALVRELVPPLADREFAPDEIDRLLDRIRHFHHHELLRIGLGDLAGLHDLATVTSQLSWLAEAVVGACLDIASLQTGIAPDGFAVLALGKLGGGELNYSSDIDLLFIAEDQSTRYQRLGETLIRGLTQATGEGFLYRVDMRLRPWGQVGPLVSTVAGHLSYLRQHARLWERQALLKARVIAGNEQVGELFLKWAAELPLDSSAEEVRADVHAMKQLTESQLRILGREWGQVKLGEGSIRDVEFITQYLQLAHGSADPYIISGNTLDGLARLVERGFLRSEEYRVLVEGYVFLRTVEHYLQIFDYRQTNSLPGKIDELGYLAHRLGFNGPDAAGELAARFQQHSAAIRAIYQHYLDTGTPAGGRMTERVPSVDVGKHIARLAPSYASTFSDLDIRSHAMLATKVRPDNPIEIDTVDIGPGLQRVTLVGYDYPGELSLICGLLFVHGYTILDGHVFTYEPSEPLPAPVSSRRAPRAPILDTRRKIVDVFTVSPVRRATSTGGWVRYGTELRELLQLLERGEQRDAQGELAKRVGTVLLEESTGGPPMLHSIDLEIDNDADPRYTVLRIDTPDTPGFLYEFTNALALQGIYISQVTVTSAGQRIQDVLWVADRQNRKITHPERQRELRAATVLVKHFTHLLPHSPNPESALMHFHEYLGQLFRNPGWPDELASLERPDVLRALARLLGVSDFLWDDFLRMQYANLFPIVRDPESLADRKPRAAVAGDLAAALAVAIDDVTSREALNSFKDREMFRIDMRNIQGHSSDAEFAAELTELAEIIITAAFHLCNRKLCAEHGEPRSEDGRPSPMTVLALGKCGGRELGYASDIELMFLYDGGGESAGPAIIGTPEYYEKLVVLITQFIRSRREGIFEIDLQLRPYGSAGSLAVSLGSFRRYFGPGGAAWNYERQALIKMRPIAGDPALGERVLALRDEFVYNGEPFDVAAMQAMRERQLRHIVTGGSMNAKYSLGGLVDVEYLVQALQISQGREHPELRTTNTADAIAALSEAGFLTARQHQRLAKAHAFLWRLTEALRIVRGNAKDLTVPEAEDEEFAFLARRMGYGNDLARLREDITIQTTIVRKLAARLLKAPASGSRDVQDPPPS